jgi:RimJ/RimL family protein N-acetyltransferase
VNYSLNEDVEIFTSRLKLATVTVAEYQLMDDFKAPADLWLNRGFKNSNQHLVNESGPLKYRIPRITKDPLFAPFALRLAVLKESSEIIGSSGFHDYPDENGVIEIGLEVLPPFRRQGFALEILHGMWGWVIRKNDVKTLRYTASITNIPSIELVKKLGFTRVGLQIDEEDGPEDIFEMSAVEYRSIFG